VTGQNATTGFGTASVTISPTTGFTDLPGLSQSLTVPSNAVVNVSADGGVETTSNATTGYSVVDVALAIDGVLTADGGYKRITAANTTGLVQMFAYFGMSQAISLTPGAHTIKVVAAGTGGGSSSALVSGDSNSVLQGELTVTILKK
jgi:hypothetical protein